MNDNTKYPEWPGNGKRHTQLSLRFAQRLCALARELDSIAEQIAPEQWDHPLWQTINAYDDVLEPHVMEPLGDGRWNPRGLWGSVEGPLGPDDIYHPEFFHVIEDIGESADLVVLHGKIVAIDGEPVD